MKGPNIVMINGWEHIHCKGESMLRYSPEFTEPRARKVAKWILANVVSRISGPTEEQLREFLHTGMLDRLPLSVMREFNPKVPI